MKGAIHKPILRAATPHVSAGTNHSNRRPHGLPIRPLYSSTPTARPSPTSSSMAVSNNSHMLFLQRSFSSHSYPAPFARRKLFLPMGAFALIGGAMLFFSSTVGSLSIPLLSKPNGAARMKERLTRHGFVERAVAPDGNCQMRALSDQILGDEKYHKDVRLNIMKWLSANEKFPVGEGGGATLGDFIDKDQFPKWASYITYMSQNGAWGDHITLLAAAEVYAVTVNILSNVDDGGTGQYITSIKPKSITPSKEIYLSHWHEMHYNSLYKESAVVGQQAA